MRKSSKQQRLNEIEEIKAFYKHEMETIELGSDDGKTIEKVYQLAGRLYNSRNYEEFYGAIGQPIHHDGHKFPPDMNWRYFHSAAQIAQTMYMYKFPEYFNKHCERMGADNLAIWFTDAS